ncbi:uncharacterized protein [Anoplolepis gracilipes]|uniref:uncharacterized protein n=1 Tax=Anoplolepis gracilipes TaxID=354296 RepID=UPI003BA01F60
MKAKVDKKGKKRSLSESSLSVKPGLKQENVTEPKKSLKKTKLASSVQNGSSTNKEQILKKMYKQKEKQKAKPQGPLAKIKTEEEIELSIAKPNEESTNKKATTKEKKLVNLKKKQEKRELQKKRRNRSFKNAASVTLSIEKIEAKIEEIRNREVLSKRAKKILTVLNRKLRLEKGADKSEQLNITEKKNKKNKQQIDTLVQIEQVSNKDKKDKINEKVKIKQKIDDQDDSDIMKNEDDENESDEDQSSTENEESMDDANEQFDDESDDDEEDEETGVDEEDEEDEDDEDDEEDEDDEDDEDDIDDKAKILNVKQEDGKKMKKQATESLEHQKKNRFVLFVGNLPFDVTADELKQHFLTKVDTVSSVRIPVTGDTKKPRGFAYVEVTNSTDFKKGLSLHHTVLKKRRINVQTSNDNKKNVGKNVPFAKNKIQAFQKAKKFTSGYQGKKKPFLKKEK